VIVLEKKAVGESFSRSRELVRGHGWTVFGIVIISAILIGIASGVIQGIFSFLPNFWRYWIGGSIANAIVDPFLAVALTLTYFELRGSPAADAPEPASEPEPPVTDPTAEA
jgi:hypothetical protein